ncbi:MAG TPA: amino acid racemase [Phycisphaerales bacterium]|nr:amino acid racemase [Phycisphaerales bacterium]
MPRHIGIVALSPEGSAVCYRRLGHRIGEIAEPAQRPFVTLHNRPFTNYLEALNRQDWNAVGAMLRESSAVLHHAGADFCILPDNVAHHALPLAEGNSAIPWVNMISLVAEHAHARGFKNVGIIGTRLVTNGSTYQIALGLKGIHLHVPPAEDTDAVDHIIFNEAVHGQVKAASSQRVLEVLRRLAESGCEAVILGSSEASCMFAVCDSPVPVIDPIDLLTARAMAMACAAGR